MMQSITRQSRHWRTVLIGETEQTVFVPLGEEMSLGRPTKQPTVSRWPWRRCSKHLHTVYAGGMKENAHDFKGLCFSWIQGKAFSPLWQSSSSGWHPERLCYIWGWGLFKTLQGKGPRHLQDWLCFERDTGTETSQCLFQTKIPMKQKLTDFLWLLKMLLRQPCRQIFNHRSLEPWGRQI